MSYSKDNKIHKESNKRLPFTIKLTVHEREQLESEAGTLALAVYIRSRLFKGDAPAVKQARYKNCDSKALAEILRALGDSHIANNLNQLAKAVNMGWLVISEDAQRDLNEAYIYVADIRHILLSALGKKP